MTSLMIHAALGLLCVALFLLGSLGLRDKLNLALILASRGFNRTEYPDVRADRPALSISNFAHSMKDRNLASHPVLWVVILNVQKTL